MQVLWPNHCVHGTDGSKFHKNLDLTPIHLIVRKGYRKGLDSYSAFFENDRISSTGLDGFLRDLGIKSIFLGGLATDYCVLYSALDAIKLGYKTFVLRDAVRGVGIPQDSVEKAYRLMEEEGICIIESDDIEGAEV